MMHAQHHQNQISSLSSINQLLITHQPPRGSHIFVRLWTRPLWLLALFLCVEIFSVQLVLQLLSQQSQRLYFEFSLFNFVLLYLNITFIPKMMGWKYMVLIVVLICSLLLSTMTSVAGASESSNNLVCEVTGTCIACRAEEMDNEYCKDTGKRIRIRCKDGPSEFDDYKPCSKTAEDGQMEVIVFQIVVGIIGGLAYWGVQSRKKYSMSLFDHRKQQRWAIHGYLQCNT